MTDAQGSIEAASGELENLRKNLNRQTSIQVQSEDEKQVIKATALSWFNRHRGRIITSIGADALTELDTAYRTLLDGTARATTRAKYVAGIKATKKRLAGVQSQHIVLLAVGPAAAVAAPSADTPPSFSPLIADPKMQGILQRRWVECAACIKAGAPLAAVVMMGGLLEGLLLARLNQDLRKANTASTAPKDKVTGKTLLFKDWGLKDFINVAHELTWITTTAKDIGEVLRDYRNYIHPQKELSHGISLSSGDADMLWNIAKNMITQLLKP